MELNGIPRRPLHSVTLLCGALLVLFLGHLIALTAGGFQCVYSPAEPVLRSQVYPHGEPSAFVTTESVHDSSYALVDPYRLSSLFHEYILIGPGYRQHKGNFDDEEDDESDNIDLAKEEIKLLLYDEDENDPYFSWSYNPDLVHQNLVKEFYWKRQNFTGVLPSLTVINSTFERTWEFHTKEDDHVAYYLVYPHLFRSQETVPPIDVLIEFPAKTRAIRTQKTLIDYQTFGLLRWRLTPAEPILWTNLRNYEYSVALNISDECHKSPVNLTRDPLFLPCVVQKRFKRVENPCIKDMFLFFSIRGDIGEPGKDESYMSVNRLFLVVPMIYSLLSYRGWYDLTEAYCSRPSEIQECGDPKDLVLTNDHLLILTDRGLWVSNSLNASTVNVSFPYTMKPLLKFTPIDPCAEFDQFNCSEVGAPILMRQTFTKYRLFYNPVCHLFQYPDYTDIVIIVYDHVTQSADLDEEQDVFTVLYAPAPYDDWHILFHSRHEYQTECGLVHIKELIGIFYNHHRRHFDITMLLVHENGTERTFRFILPEPTEDGFKGYDLLSGILGDGYLEYEFPATFEITSVAVNMEVMDVLFLGNQLWIAEAASAFVYLSVAGVEDNEGNPSHIDSCSFNHPDRSFVCVEKSHDEILTGRVGVNYAPLIVKYDNIREFESAGLINLWPTGFRRSIGMLGNFIAGYSGKIMLWFLYDSVSLHEFQKSSISRYTNTCAKAFVEYPVRCFLCSKLQGLNLDPNCSSTDVIEEPEFRMLALDPVNYIARSSALHGPLVPFLIDGDKVVIFEADIPTLPGFKPDRNFLNVIHVGSRIHCVNVTSTPAWTGAGCPPFNFKSEIHSSECELYIRQVKDLRRRNDNAFLKGFRSVTFAHVSKAFPLYPVPTDLVVLVLPNSNDALIHLDNSMYENGYEFVFRYGHIGQTLYIPEAFSVLLVGFPKKTVGPPDHDTSLMVGLTTRYYRQGAKIHVPPFKSFIVDFATTQYCDFHVQGIKQFDIKDPKSRELVVGEYEERRDIADKERNERLNPDGSKTLEPLTYHALEDAMLKVTNPTIPVTGTVKIQLERAFFHPKITPNLTCSKGTADHWNLIDGGCHLRLTLADNAVLKQGGGRISLDKHDSISFVVNLRSLTPLGKSLMHRPLISITNTNPNVLVVNKEEAFGRDPQHMRITLSPTGFRKGVAIVTVRPEIISIKCPFADGSFTLIVQVHRREGRRLNVNYPIPRCTSRLENGNFRPWKQDLPTCVTREELLTKSRIRRPDTEFGQVFYSTLPANYRPPSLRGAEIPLSRNVYNVNPAEPKYKNWYRISAETSVLSQCMGKASRKACECTLNDELSDDVLFTDCKRRVYTAKRGLKIDISVEYDRVMRDGDQHGEFFSPKHNWSMYVEEVNNRIEFTLSSTPSLYLETVNKESNLHEGRTFYDAKTLGVTLHGTGLFHFKVGLGKFESFDEVTGYFMIFCDDTELNHVQLVVIMLLTITVCMVFVFCGFLVVRNRLSTQLPFRTQVKNKIKLE